MQCAGRGGPETCLGDRRLTGGQSPGTAAAAAEAASSGCTGATEPGSEQRATWTVRTVAAQVRGAIEYGLRALDSRV